MISKIHEKLGIPKTYEARTGLRPYQEPNDLVSIGDDVFGRPQALCRAAATQWNALYNHAHNEGIVVHLVSAFRSVDYQTSLIEKKLAENQKIENILKTMAAPGYSEHHSGRALDLSTDNCQPLNAAFERTAAFLWLTANASDYGFHMSYPRDNKWCIDYEPWHWCYRIT